MPIEAKVCVVTGASRGIGRACAETLRAAGGRVAVCASSAAPEAPDGVLSRRCDVSVSEDVARFFREVERQLGPPDVVVLNAGVLERGPIEGFTEEQWDRVLGVNLQGVFCSLGLPGSLDTEMLKKTPFSPQIQPGEVAQVVRFLAAEAPFAMTGSAVEVFG